MSEFSESYHIRTADPDEVLGRLRKARITGFAFPPKTGWLTFVPFANTPSYRKGGFLADLLRAGEPILRYRFAEDHGWVFELFRRGKNPIKYECWWDPEPMVDRTALDLDAISALLPDATQRAELERVLTDKSDGEPANGPAAYRFAELLGLPAYKWLSPDYAQRDPESIVAMGARQIGTRPPDMTDAIPRPPDRSIRLPRPDLSAREAFAIAEMVMKPWASAWFAVRVIAHGALLALDEQGRSRDGGVWGVDHEQAAGTAYIRIWIWREGRISASVSEPGMPPGSVLTADGPDPAKSVPLSAEWLDSPAALAALKDEPAAAGAGTLIGRTMSLRQMENLAVWEIDRTWASSSAYDAEQVRISHAVEAKSRAIIANSFRCTRAGKTIEERVERRF